MKRNPKKLNKGVASSKEGQVRPWKQYGTGEFGTTFSTGSIPSEFQRNLTYPKEGPNSAVYSAIMAYAWALSAAGLDHIRYEEDGSSEILNNSAPSKVLRYPNAYQQEGDLILSMVTSLLYEGNSYVFAAKELGKIKSLHPLPPGKVTTILASDYSSVWYEVSTDAEISGDVDSFTNPVPSRYIAHTKLYTNNNPIIGVSPITACSLSSSLGTTIQGQTLSFHTNMRRPSGMLKTAMVLNKDQMSELRARWDEQSAVWEAGGVPIASAGLEWQALGVNALDSEVIETYKMTVEDIARVFRIPTSLMGLGGMSGDTEQLLSTWKMQGLLFVAEQIERSLERLFDLPYNEEFRFDLDTLSRASLAVQVETLAKGVMGGVMSPDEARKKLGYGKVPYGDEPRLQAQQVPLSMVGKTMDTSAPTTPNNNQEPNNPVIVVDDKEDSKIQNTTKELVLAQLNYIMKQKELTNG